jgi:hypothetical protein
LKRFFSWFSLRLFSSSFAFLCAVIALGGFPKTQEGIEGGLVSFVSTDCAAGERVFLVERLGH